MIMEVMNSLHGTQYTKFNIGEWKKDTNFTIRTFLRILDAHEITIKDFFETLDKN